MRAYPAEGHREDNSDQVDVLGENGDYQTSWWCVCPSASEVISAGNAGNLDPMSEDGAWYDSWISAFEVNTTNKCIARAAQIGSELGTVILFDGVDDVSCGDAVADEIPNLSPGETCLLDCDGELPPVPGTGGDPEPTTGADTTAGDGGGMHVYGIDDWADVIVETGANNYLIDRDFLASVREDLTILSDDNIGVGAGVSSLSHAGFEFETVGGDSIADALEFEEGDIVWELNGERFENVDDIHNAFETMSEKTTFAVKVDRGSTTVVKTMTITDLTTYP